MISGSFATTGSTQTRTSLSYINELVTGATAQGLYRIVVPNQFMDDNMANVLRRTYGYQVQSRTSLMGTFDDYIISWAPPMPTATPAPTAYPTATPTQTPNPTPNPTETNYPTPNPTSTPNPTPSPTASGTPSPTAVPTATPAAPTPTPTATSLYQSYNYSISATDIAAATGNTGPNAAYNNKVVVVVTNGYNCGNTTVRNFTYSFDSAGPSYISWLISLKTDIPVLGYYKDDVLVTTGLISTQTANPTVPC